jgi:diguanylate cyclase (GGDEF)-like protein
VSPRTGTTRQKATAGVVEALASSTDADEALGRAAAAITAAEKASLVQIWAAHGTDGFVCRAVWAEDATGRDGEQSEPVGALADLAWRPDLLAVLEGAELVEWRAGGRLPDDALALLVAFFAARLFTLPVRVDDAIVGALTVVQDGSSSKSTAAQRNRLAALAKLLSDPLRPLVVEEKEAPAKGQADAPPVVEFEDEASAEQTAGPRAADQAAETVARQVAALRDAAHAVVTILDADQAVAAVKAHIATLVGGRECRVRVFLLTPPEGYAEFPPRPADDGAKGHRAEGPADLERRAIAEGRTLTAMTPGAVRLASPLRLRGAPLGYLTLIAGRTDPLTPTEIAAVETLAQQICLALDIARLRRAVQGLTTVDTLTGLRNREFLFERLTAEMARAKRYGESLSLLRMDLDDFTAFNAAHGNREGNRLLRTAANLVKMSIREDVDVVCRFAGGEFAILLPNTLAAAGAAGIVAERLRSTIETTQFHDDYDNRLGHVTASLGVAGFPAHAEDVDDLVNLTGEALRAAKAAGKNKVGLYSQRH